MQHKIDKIWVLESFPICDKTVINKKNNVNYKLVTDLSNILFDYGIQLKHVQKGIPYFYTVWSCLLSDDI